MCEAELAAAHIPLYLYPFLNTVSKTRPFEYLRLTSLGVIGALVKARTACTRYFASGQPAHVIGSSPTHFAKLVSTAPWLLRAITL